MKNNFIYYRSYPRNFNIIKEKVKIRTIEYMPNEVKLLLDNSISNSIKSVLVEYPYVDLDYRDTYYNDFSKRFMPFERDSFRIHFFTKTEQEVNSLKDLTEDKFQDLNQSYKGFITLRDTRFCTIGRSYLHPTALKDTQNCFYVLSKYRVNIKGYTFMVDAYPWMQQDANVTRCAQVAMWSIIRYFSEKYHKYAEKTLYQIAALASGTKRKSPSTGLTIHQLSQVFTDCLFSAEIYSKEIINKIHKEDDTFYKILYILIESGLPYIAKIVHGITFHAVAIIGHGKINDAEQYCRGKKGIIDSSELVDTLIVSDDNCLPYKNIKRTDKVAAEYYPAYSIDNIEEIIVPFYERMYLDVRHILKLLPPLEDKLLNLNKENCYIRRIFMASSMSFKKYINEKGKDKIYKDIIINSTMPKFIWIIEYSNPNEYKERLIRYRVMLDSSGLNYLEPLNVILNMKKENKLVVERVDKQDASKLVSQIFTLKSEMDIAYIHNLEEIKS